MTALYVQVIGTVIAAGVIGLLAGWMAQRARAARTLRSTVASWEKRYELLESGSNDGAELETQVQELGAQLRALTDDKRTLQAELADAHQALAKAQDAAVRLNAQQADVQARLQRTLREREQPLPDRSRSTTAQPDTSPPTLSRLAVSQASQSAPRDVEAYIDRLSDRGDRHRDRAPAVAGAAAVGGFMDASLDDPMDDTALLEPDDDITSTYLVDPMETTEAATLAFEDAESTVAFDEDTLARVRARAAKH